VRLVIQGVGALGCVHVGRATAEHGQGLKGIGADRWTSYRMWVAGVGINDDSSSGAANMNIAFTALTTSLDVPDRGRRADKVTRQEYIIRGIR